MKIVIHGSNNKLDNDPPTYAYTPDGTELGLYVRGFPGTIQFDSAEEAEEIAGAILVGLKKNDLPYSRRGEKSL